MSTGGLIVAAVLLVLLALTPAVIAQGKGRPFWGWWFLGLFFLLPALIAALIIRPTDLTKRQGLATEGYRACPYCAEMIRPQAIACRYCGRDLPPGGVAPEPAERWSPDADEAADRAWRQVEGNN